MLTTFAPIRDKDELEPVLPLPRWAPWAIAAWTIGMIAFYTTVLAGWWE